MKNRQTVAGSDRVRRLLALDRSTLPTDGGPGFNRLIFSTSPYLLQHAENPVDWYPWGEEAFARARDEDKPVLVSIGYATCHWCHVMAHESFEDSEVAAALRRTCIAIKVDREERPDIDAQYLLVAQLLTGSGGWPLNVLLTPEKEPFFAATYLPKISRGGLPGLIELLEQIGSLWRGERSRIQQTCATLSQALAGIAAPAAPADLPGPELLREATAQLAARYDPEFKGFGPAPKFPLPVNLVFLLRAWSRHRQPALLRMVTETLMAMRHGGLCDQLGFGFHRYSVDRAWLVPHFEKMLYDQALLALVAIETWQASGDDRYRSFAAEIFAYLSRDLTAPNGGFYAAEDADSAGAEGTFYLWTPKRLTAILGAEAGATAGALFGVSEAGNFEGRSILHLPLSLTELARRMGVAPAILAADCERWRQALLAARAGRERPLRDEKLVTAWNGLAIAALAKGYAASGEAAWREQAESAVACIRARLVTPQGRLLRSYSGGVAAVPGFLEDYACFVWGLIELHQATLAGVWLEEALRLSRAMLRLFAAPQGGLFEVGADAEQLPVRLPSGQDGVLPAGGAVAALNLLRLGRIADDPGLSAAGAAVLRAQMGSATRQPLGYLFHFCTLDFALGPQLELTVCGGSDGERVALLRSAGRHFLPGLVLRDGGAAVGLRVEVCTAGVCRPPLTDLAGVEQLLATMQQHATLL